MSDRDTTPDVLAEARAFVAAGERRHSKVMRPVSVDLVARLADEVERLRGLRDAARQEIEGLEDQLEYAREVQSHLSEAAVAAQEWAEWFAAERDLWEDRAGGAGWDLVMARLALDRVRKHIEANTDGEQHEHVDGCEGEPTCPACWVASIRRALDGEAQG